MRRHDPWGNGPSRHDVIQGHINHGTITQRVADIWEAYPDPDEARQRVATKFKRELIDVDVDELEDKLQEVQDELLDTQDPQELAKRTGLDPYALQRLIPKILDDDRGNNAGHAILRTRFQHAPAPLPGLIDGDIAMVGTLPGGVRCGEHMVVRCQPCYQKWDSDDYDGYPHPYTRTENPVGCETPDCFTCKGIYVPTRAAAAALRVQRFLDKTPRDVVLRHVVVSPPWDTLDELAQENYGPPDRSEIGKLETHVNKLVERKGAIATIIVRHPWRGWWGPEKPWRESWHWHVLAAFPADGQGVPDQAAPSGWTQDFLPGGAKCCAHKDAYRSDVDDGHQGSCCTGEPAKILPVQDLSGPSCTAPYDDPDEVLESICFEPRCPHRRIHQARDRVRSLAGKLGAARREGDGAKAKRLEHRLRHAQAEHAAAKQAACDQGWLFHVTEDVNGDPKTVSTDPHALKGGACEGIEVPAGVLALLQYELDHAGSVRDNKGRTKLHTIKWYGDWSYRNLELGHDDQHALTELKEGITGAACPNCGQGELQPVHDPREHHTAVRFLNDTDLRAQRLKKIELAKQMGWITTPSGNHSRQDSGAHAAP